MCGSRAIRNPIWNYVPCSPFEIFGIEEKLKGGHGERERNLFANQPERFKGDLFYANLIYYLKAYDTVVVGGYDGGGLTYNTYHPTVPVTIWTQLHRQLGKVHISLKGSPNKGE